MKQFPLLFLFAVLLSFSSCYYDHDGSIVLEEPTPPSPSSVDASVNFSANYDGTPFVIGDTYEYEDGTPIFFTRFNFFVSDVALIAADGSEVEISNIELVDFTNQNLDIDSANEGYNIEFSDVATGEYTGMRFGIGVSDELNATSPSDYSGTHPLGGSGDYWAAWDSYIFAKLEGKVDVDLDGTFTSGIVYHTGGNEYYNEIEFDMPITIDEDNTSLPTIDIDVRKLLVRSENDYLDIINNSAVHQDGELMKYVVQNYLQAIKAQ